MSLKIGGVDPSKIMVAGQPATKVMVGTGSANVEVWSAVPPWSGQTVTIPAQTVPTSSSPVAGSAITIPETYTGQFRLRATLNWANRNSGYDYRIRLNRNGGANTSWEFAPRGSGSYTQVLEIGYGTPPYPDPRGDLPGSVYEVAVWLTAPSATNRQLNQSTFTIEAI